MYPTVHLRTSMNIYWGSTAPVWRSTRWATGRSCSNGDREALGVCTWNRASVNGGQLVNTRNCGWDGRSLFQSCSITGSIADVLACFMRRLARPWRPWRLLHRHFAASLWTKNNIGSLICEILEATKTYQDIPRHTKTYQDNPNIQNLFTILKPPTPNKVPTFAWNKP